MSVSSSSSTPTGIRALAHLPAEIQTAHAQFLATGEVEAADRVLLAIVREHIPHSRQPAAGIELHDESRLIEDLGFDSLAIAEVVFFVEDLYRVRIPQDQLLRLTRVGDLRAYLRTRLQTGTG
jgi:acyl carrier protein